MSIFLKLSQWHVAAKTLLFRGPKYSYSLLRVVAITPFQGVIKTTFKNVDFFKQYIRESILSVCYKAGCLIRQNQIG